MRTDWLRKVARSVLFRVPRLYDLIGSHWRFVLAHRLGRLDEGDFLALPSLVTSATPLVLDVGANLGQSVLSAKRALPSARVISFEPNPANWPALEYMRRHFPDVRIERFGLADKEDERDFFCPSYNGKAMTGLASFDRGSASGWLSDRTVFGFRPELLTIRTTTLRVRRLDDLGLQPDVIKIDVQGYEEQVVRGGLDTIRRCRPVLLIESPDRALQSLLDELGYSSFEFDGTRLHPSRGTHVNQFFLHADHPAPVERPSDAAPSPRLS